MGLTNVIDRRARLGKVPGLALSRGSASRIDGTARVRAYAGLVVAAGVSGAVAISLTQPPPGHVLVTWWMIAIGYLGATGLAVHVHLGRDAHTVTLTEVPMTVGLCLAAPSSLFAGAALGSALALLLVRRQPVVKLIFNVGLHLATIALCISILHLARQADDPMVPLGWLTVLTAALLVSGLGGSLVVAGIIRLTGDRSVVGGMRGVLPVTLTACFMNTLVGLAGARLVDHDGIVAILVAVPCVACIATYRLYTREHSERTRLSLLYESARAFGGARDVDAVVRTLLQRARQLLRGERAELLLLPPDSDGEVLRVRIDGSGKALVHAVLDPGTCAAIVAASGRVLPRSGRDPSTASTLALLEARDAVVVQLRGEAGALGCLAVMDRAGDVASFGGDDLALLEAFAGQAATSLSHARVSAELHELAFHDALTGLANRALLTRRLEAAVRRQGQRNGEGTGFAVAYLDLDDFKMVNDSLGHSAGDRLLVEVAGRLRRSLRAGDLAARLGGDEFCVLFEGVEGATEAAAVAERLLDTLRRPMSVEGVWIGAAASAGVVVVPGDAEVDAGSLLSQADVAMYRAKARGKGGVELFEPSMQAQVLERHRLKLDLEHAVRQRRMRVAFQPISALDGGEIVGVEALVRWNEPGRGDVAPSDFVPLAEETGLIHELGTFVLEAACAQAAAWQRLRPGLFVSVNLSLLQLRDPAFQETVAGALRTSGLEPSLLMLEVTETVMVTDDADQRTTLRELRELGCRLAIDDFGTGYSSLASLQELPVDTLKIAKPFVDGLGCGPERDAFAKAIVGLGRTLGLTTIAEGIETAEQARILQDLHCSMGQGYLMARPMLAPDLERLLVSTRN